ncbi:hypothetical protein FPCIR_12250 [Fusarium pseudocircinatum]|uniref:Uncharacterized protein n=1 Tax=Fusarium pseudocircinatum TaxID=56676 RepID=A0A8H5KRC9_9HYPO|nr:hypothetical protein FPCIR_12250 [Fusarium pseudocircinatum]
MWLLTTVNSSKLLNALRKLGINKLYLALSFYLFDAISITTTCTSVTLDFISILEAEVEDALCPSNGLVSGAQTITGDPAFEGNLI